MKVCYIYYFVEPIKEQYFDDGSKVILEFDIPGTEHNFSVALIGSDDVPEIMRISIKYVNEDKIPEITLNAIQMIKEHMVSTLRTSYDPSIGFNKFSAWNFIPQGQAPNLSIRMQMKHVRVPVNQQVIQNNFTSTWENRYLIKLLTEGLNEEFPLYYRFLSLYRILEDLFKFNGKWDMAFNTLLDNFKDQYYEKEVSALTLLAYLETLRNRCAHGKFIFKKADQKGITQLDNKALQELQEFMPLMLEIVVSAINSNEDVNGTFFIGVNKPK